MYYKVKYYNLYGQQLTIQGQGPVGKVGVGVVGGGLLKLDPEQGDFRRHLKLFMLFGDVLNSGKLSTRNLDHPLDVGSIKHYTTGTLHSIRARSIIKQHNITSTLAGLGFEVGIPTSKRHDICSY